MKQASIVAVACVASLFLSTPALAWVWGARAKVGSVYINDSNGAYIDVSVGQACGTGHPAETRLNIRAGAAGQDQLLKLATSALLSDRAVDVAVTWDATIGVCMLDRMRLIAG